MNDDALTRIAQNLIVGFLLSLGLQPSEGEDTLEIRDFGPHRVFVQRAEVPNVMADSIDRDVVLTQLVEYIDHHNALPTAVKFQPYDVEVFVCPCGCGTFVYVSVTHAAE